MKLPRGEWTVKGKRRCKEGADTGRDVLKVEPTGLSDDLAGGE